MSAELKEVELQQQALTVADSAKAIVVRDQVSYNLAAEKLLGVRQLIRQIDDTFDPDIKRWHEGHKAAIATKKKVLGDLPMADGILVKLIGTWEQEQARIRFEAQRKADEEARRIEEEARIALAVQAEELGATEETVQEIVNTPMPVQRQVITPTFERAAGIGASRKPVYKWRTIDEKQIPREYLMVDQIKINGIVRAMGNATKIPGIQVYEDLPNISVRTR
jgi:hypothetical protein